MTDEQLEKLLGTLEDIKERLNTLEDIKMDIESINDKLSKLNVDTEAILLLKQIKQQVEFVYGKL